MFTKSAQFYDAIYSWKDYQADADKLHAMITEHKQSDGNTLLDVACGTGGHFPYLREHYTLTGLDLDDKMLAVARDRFSDISLHQASMVDFDLGQTFDVVTCLFSSIGYVVTVEALNQTIETFYRHTKPGGVVIVEPWFAAERINTKRVSALHVDEADLKITRMNTISIEDGVSTIHFHYLVGIPGKGVNYFTEDHVVGLFTHEQYLHAFTSVGLDVGYDSVGLMDRGLYIGTRPLA